MDIHFNTITYAFKVNITIILFCATCSVCSIVLLVLPMQPYCILNEDRQSYDKA